ncbi:MAG TPA: alpha/beta fold hydrolase [Mycobacterium sp.]|uniref:alpha/beta fold hydrolase n=1 Tax=Mycobacterium sp. TaxID=1785 RepID=UPI002D614A24|nr:alpha/beta fold hydrolase [Mycobacterium sp.]HXY62987.1 alpha/beta fold hydrolase [Mycobacterium sp.]
MTLPDLVLVHGGAHAADCWELTIAELACQEPKLRVLAVDLPGRGRNPADLATVNVAGWVDSVVADVEKAGFHDIVLVGHSMAGITVPGVVARLGPSRVRELILAAAFVPPEGLSVVDVLRGPLAPLARMGVRINKSFKMPIAAANFAFCNGMSQDQRAFALARIYAESPRVIAEAVDRRDLPDEVARTWIMTLRDRALSVRQQRGCISALGGVETLICIDTCHDLMYSEPRRLAEILIERCHFRAQHPD